MVMFSGGITDTHIQSFETSFYQTARQKKTMLGSSNAVVYHDPNTAKRNIGRMAGTELTEVYGRNSLKQIDDYTVDNRQYTKRHFAKTFLLDGEIDIVDMLTNPTADLLTVLNDASNVALDRVTLEASIGDVLVGDPNAGVAMVTKTAAQDGVRTVDATAGLTYAKIQAITQNFINQHLSYEQFSGSNIMATGKENTALMSETNFISNDYISSKPVEKGVQERAGTYGIQLIAGSDSTATLVNPLIKELSGSRYCPVLAPNSVAIMKKIKITAPEKMQAYNDSWGITINLWVGAMRLEGAKVQILKTTI